MIYLRLFLEFLKVGCFTFGGSYGAVPIIRDAVIGNAWLTEERLAYFIAVSESTPGPIMINMATYIGASQAGILGALCATLGVVIPSFLVILLISSLLKRYMQKPLVRSALDGIRPAVVGMICATGGFMLFESVLGGVKKIAFSWQAAVISGVLIAVYVIYAKIRKKSISSIVLIGMSAVLGIILY